MKSFKMKSSDVISGRYGRSIRDDLQVRTHCGTLLRLEELMSESTNSRNFRTKLSEFFDKAVDAPVAVTRGTERFVLMNEEEYLSLKDEVMSLQRNLLSVLDVRSGNSESFENPEKHLSTLFDKISAKGKKVVGE